SDRSAEKRIELEKVLTEEMHDADRRQRHAVEIEVRVETIERVVWHELFERVLTPGRTQERRVRLVPVGRRKQRAQCLELFLVLQLQQRGSDPRLVFERRSSVLRGECASERQSRRRIVARSCRQ